MTRGVLRKLRWLLISIALTVLVTGAHAHESRPAYLEITETAPGRYDVLWRTPVLAGTQLPVVLRMPAEARNMTESAVREFQDSLVERRMVEIAGGLAGKRIEFAGLETTSTAVLARVQLGD